MSEQLVKQNDALYSIIVRIDVIDKELRLIKDPKKEWKILSERNDNEIRLFRIDTSGLPKPSEANSKPYEIDLVLICDENEDDDLKARYHYTFDRLPQLLRDKIREEIVRKASLPDIGRGLSRPVFTYTET